MSFNSLIQLYRFVEFPLAKFLTVLNGLFRDNSHIQARTTLGTALQIHYVTVSFLICTVNLLSLG